MGANQSSDVNNCLNSLNESINTVITKQSQTTEAQNTIVQEINVQLGSIDNCDIIETQRIKANSSIQAIATFNSTSNIDTMMQASLSSALTSAQKSVNGFMSLAFSNQNSSASNNENITNIVKNNVTNDNKQSLISFATKLQAGNVQAGSCLNGVIDVSQDAIVKTYVSAVSSTITAALLKNKEIAAAVAKTAVSQSSHNEGIASFFKAWGMVMIGVVIAIILLIILLPKLLGGGSSSQPPGGMPGGMPGGEEGGEAAEGGGAESDIVETVEANPELLAAFKFYNKRKLNRFYY